MSLRTRQSLALPALLVLLVTACTGTNPATTNPTGTPATTPGGSTNPTPVTTPAGSPGTSSSPGESSNPSTTPGSSGNGTDAGPEGQIFRIYCCSTDVR